jgi:5-methylcytosine-specific restriction enzyme A
MRMSFRSCLVCAEPVIPGGSRCAKHAGSSGWAQRPSVGTQRGLYGGHWQQLRRQVLAEADHACQCRDRRCGHGSLCGAHAGTVDHLVSIARGGAVYDRANLQALCWRCHARKTGRESAAAKKEAARRRSVIGRGGNET